MVSFVGWRKCRVSAGVFSLSSPLFSERELLLFVVFIGGAYGGGGGGGTAAPAEGFPPFKVLVAKSYEGGSRRPEGRGFDGGVAIWQ